MLTSALAGGLHDRGVPEPVARLSAELGIAVFYVAFDQWLSGTENRELVDIVREGFNQLKAVTSEASSHEGIVLKNAYGLLTLQRRTEDANVVSSVPP